MEEIWKPIAGYEGSYEVSSLGRVRSLDRKVSLYNGGSYIRKGALMVLRTNYDGYLDVNLSKDGASRKRIVHRLVAEAFIENPDNLPEVNHKDEDKKNNSVENLEWCSREYNMNYGTARVRATKAISIPVRQYTRDGELVAEYPSGREAGRRTGITEQCISLCCLGRRNHAGGFIWEYNKSA